MTLADLEREWNRRKRGRRKERTVLALAVVLVLACTAAAYWAIALR